MDYKKCIYVAMMLMVNLVFQAASQTSPIVCLAERRCLDTATRVNFACRDKHVECCADEGKGVTLHPAPRGTACCSGRGMYNKQTHHCPRDDSEPVRPREGTGPCPGEPNVLYNSNTMICCSDSQHVTMTHMTKPDYKCCGKDYINSGQGCCDELAYFKSENCCLNDTKISPKHECDESPIVCPARACPQEYKDVTKLLKNGAAYEYVFKVRDVIGTVMQSIWYETTSSRQFKGKREKLKTVSLKLRRIGLPICGCHNRLEAGKSYLLITRRKTQSKKLNLREGDYFILPLEQS